MKKKPYSYIRAHHGLCRAAENLLQHTVAVGGYYLPASHVIATTWFVGDTNLESVIEKLCDKGIDYTAFTMPSLGKIYFSRSEFPKLPETALPVVLEISKFLLVENTHGEKLKVSKITLNLKTLWFNKNSQSWEINQRELPVTAVPAFFGLNNSVNTKELNEFCDNNNIFVETNKNIITPSIKPAAEGRQHLQPKYPEPPVEIICGDQKIVLYAWLTRELRKELTTELIKNKIFAGCLAKIPVLDAPIPLSKEGRLPANLVYEINRCLRKDGHVFVYDEVQKMYQFRHRDTLKTSASKSRKAFAAYAANEDKFVQQCSHGFMGAIWD